MRAEAHVQGRGIGSSERLVWRLMHDAGSTACPAYQSPQGKGPTTGGDLVERQFA